MTFYSRIFFGKINKLKCEETAFSELIRKQQKWSKGRTLKYRAKLEMALSPNDQLTTEDHKLIKTLKWPSAERQPGEWHSAEDQSCEWHSSE